MSYNTLEILSTEQVITIKLNRVNVKNAINLEMIDELMLALADAYQSEHKIIILTANGDNFCSGADLNWLKEGQNYDYDTNYNQSLKLIQLFNFMKSIPKPIIAVINGDNVGGGIGLMLSSDIILSSKSAKFGLSQLKYGIVPAAIIHLLIERIGLTKTNELILTGERISAEISELIGLIKYALSSEMLDIKLKELINNLLKNSSVATAKAKEMIHQIKTLDQIHQEVYIASTIADLRLEQECLKGIDAFLSKSLPKYN